MPSRPFSRRSTHPLIAGFLILLGPAYSPGEASAEPTLRWTGSSIGRWANVTSPGQVLGRAGAAFRTNLQSRVQGWLPEASMTFEAQVGLGPVDLGAGLDLARVAICTPDGCLAERSLEGFHFGAQASTNPLGTTGFTPALRLRVGTPGVGPIDPRLDFGPNFGATLALRGVLPPPGPLPRWGEGVVSIDAALVGHIQASATGVDAWSVKLELPRASLGGDGDPPVSLVMPGGALLHLFVINAIAARAYGGRGVFECWGAHCAGGVAAASVATLPFLPVWVTAIEVGANVYDGTYVAVELAGGEVRLAPSMPDGLQRFVLSLGWYNEIRVSDLQITWGAGVRLSVGANLLSRDER